MTQTVALPVDPARLADLVLAPGAEISALCQWLADQVGARPARQLLADACSVAAERLRAAAA